MPASAQLSLFEQVQHPGARGGHYRITPKGEVRYDRPRAKAPGVPRLPETPAEPAKPRVMLMRRPSRAAIEKLRASADALQPAIDKLADPAIGRQNITARRARIAGNMSDRARGLERAQRILRNLAAHHEAGTVPEVLASISKKPQVDALLRRYFPGPTIHPTHLRDALEAARAHGLTEHAEVLAAAVDRVADHEDAWKIEHPESVHDAIAGVAGYDNTHPRTNEHGRRQRLYVPQALESRIERRHLADAGITAENFEAARAALEGLDTPPPPDPQAKVKAMERDLIGRRWPGFFPTPVAASKLAVTAAGLVPGMRVLEPSAGKGDMAAVALAEQPGITVQGIERVPELAAIAQEKGVPTTVGDFLSMAPEATYDRVVMNPPFEGGADAEHVQHAYQWLKPGGRLVAIVSSGLTFRDDQKAKGFRNWLASVGGRFDPMPEGSFQRHETSDSTTGVRTALVVADKPGGWAPSFDDKHGMGAVPDGQEIDYMGFRRLMRPSDFLRLNPERVQAPKPEMVEKMRAGQPIGHPFISVEEEGDAYRIYSHEGRGRVMAMQQLGYDQPFEVHVFVRGKRARHLTDDDRRRPLLPDKRNAEMRKALATEITGIEADLLYADEELLPSLDADDPRRPALVQQRAERIGKLVALDEAFAKVHSLEGSRVLGPLSIAIETAKGATREWHAQDGTNGTQVMKHHYGYVRGTLGMDGDAYDCFLGPKARTGLVERTNVYVVETKHPPDFQADDEHKAMIGFDSKRAAVAAFLDHYDGESRFIGSIETHAWPMFVQQMVTNQAVRHTPVLKAEPPVPVILPPSPEPHRPATWWQRGLLLLKGGFGAPKPPGARPPGPGGPLQPPSAPMGPMPPAPQQAVHPEQAIDSKTLAKGIMAHVEPLEALVEQLTKLFPGEPIAGRLKETKGFAAKVAGAQQGGQQLDAAQDFASVRMTFDALDDVALAAERIKRVMQVSGEQNFVDQPRGGYRSYDLTVSASGQPIEVQLRTPGMNAWAEWMHDASYRQKRAGQPINPAVTQYAMQLSAYLAGVDRGEGGGAPPPIPPEVEQIAGAPELPAGGKGAGNAVVDRRPRS